MSREFTLGFVNFTIFTLSKPTESRPSGPQWRKNGDRGEGDTGDSMETPWVPEVLVPDSW